MKSERGFSLLETIVAVVLLSIIAAVFLGATATTSTSRVTADEHASARIIAESMMEDIKEADYDSSYSFDIPEEFPGYSAQIDVDNLRNGYIQKITITVIHHNKAITTLESYKTERNDDVS